MLPGESRVVQTSLGSVEYMIQGNSDQYVLLVHGTPGSYRTFMADALVKEGFTVISPSRPGYFRTPLSSGETIPAQSALYAELLESLSVDSASIIGFSGGGPSALMFASLFPEKCTGLVVLASSGRSFDQPSTPFIQDIIMGSEFGRWSAYSSLSGEFEEEEAVVALEYLQTAFFPLEEVIAGEENDFSQFTSPWKVDLSSVQCPALIIHGTEDELIPFSEATYLDQQISNSRLLAKEGQDHFTVVFFEFRENLKEAARFLSNISK